MGKTRGRLVAVVAVACAAYLVSGCIIFAQPTEYQVSAVENTRVSGVLYADVTGDGTDDLIVVTSDSTVQRMEPCGPGCLTPREVVLASNVIQPLALSAADFDGDGTEDVVVKGFFIEVFFGSSGGAGREPGLAQADVVTLPIGSSAPIAADLTGDGHPDLGVLYPTEPGHLVPMPLGYGILPGDGAGGFGALLPVAQGLFDDRSFNSKLAVGDVDWDGSPEAIAWGHTLGTGGIEDSSVVALSATGAVVAEWHDQDVGYLTSLAVGDLDDDGADDLAIGVNRDGQSNVVATEVILLRSTPEGFGPFGSAGEPTVLTPRTGVFDVALADVDADGHVDVVTTPGYEYQQPGWLSWWYGSAAGIAPGATRTDRELPKPVGLIAFGDTGDPRPDLALGQPGGPFSALYAVPNVSK